MTLSRIDKILDYAYNEHSLWNVFATTIIIISGTYLALEELIRIQRAVNRGEIKEVD